MSYPGSKAAVFRRIIGEMPPHSIYVEAFAGSGVVLRQKKPAAATIAIDRDVSILAPLGEIAGVQTICGDASSILPTLDLPADALVYCDPPYVLSTRKNRRYYKFEMTDADHARLLSVLKVLPCRVMLSGYASELYLDALREWRACSYKVRTRGRTVEEFLWCNFPQAGNVHDWRYAGLTWRERYNLKRYAARLIARTPERKRGYLLAELANAAGLSLGGEPYRHATPRKAIRDPRAARGDDRSRAQIPLPL